LPTQDPIPPSSVSVPSRTSRVWLLLALVAVAACALLIIFGSDLLSHGPSVDPIERARQADERFEHLEQQVAEADEQGGEARLRTTLNEVKAAIAAFPEDARGYRILAWCYARLEEPQHAYEQFIESLKRDPKQPHEQLHAGLTAAELEQYDEAIEHIQRAVDLSPTEPDYRLHLANMYIKTRQFNKAEDLLLYVLGRLDSGNSEANALLADIRAKENDARQAIVHLDRALETAETSNRKRYIDLILQKAKLQQRIGSAEMIRKSLLTLDQLDEEERYLEPVLAAKAASYALNGTPEKAAEMYADAFFFDQINAELARQACEWYIRAGNEKQASQYLQKLAKVSPRHPMLGSLREKIDKLVDGH